MSQDLLQPGEDGELPGDFREWQRGVTYTVRPGMLAPLARDRDYWLNTTIRRIRGAGEPAVSYAGLYQRATAILDARIAEITAGDSAAPHQWIVAQAWFSQDVRGQVIDSAAITRGVSYRTTLRAGTTPPAAADLEHPSGGTPEQWASSHLDEAGRRRDFDELYVDFEYSERVPDITISYGEYVPACDGVDFGAMVRRAENLARFHRGTLGSSNAGGEASFQFLRREWACLSTDKASDPAMITVHVYFRL